MDPTDRAIKGFYCITFDPFHCNKPDITYFTIY